MPDPIIFGTHDDKTLAQLADVASRAERAALMADGARRGTRHEPHRRERQAARPAQ